MAVDEAILQYYRYGRVPTLRIYGWDRPAVSLGYNQQPADVLDRRITVPFVRRMTGGSAIFHHQEVTYSITCSRHDLDLPPGVKNSYRRLCSFLKIFYQELGLKAEFAAETPEGACGRLKNFCFSGRQDFDLIIKGRKIGGNAQRRRKNIIFQQGSIPQELDFQTIEKSIKDAGRLGEKTVSLNILLGRKTDFCGLRSLLGESFRTAFGVDFSLERLNFEEERIGECLLQNKYAQEGWNLTRTEAGLAR